MNFNFMETAEIAAYEMALENRGFTAPAAKAVVENENLFDLLKQMNDIEGLDAAGEKVQEEINANPEIAGILESQLQDDPSLKGRVLDMARNDPAALSAKIPQMLDNPEQAAAVFDGRAALPDEPSTAPPTETVASTSNAPENTAVSSPTQQEQTAQSQTREEPVNAAASATGIASENAKGPEALQENFNWQSGAASEQAPAQEAQAEAAVQEQAEQNISNTAGAAEAATTSPATENTAAAAEEISPQREMISSMKFMMAQPGGEEFFENIKENPELNEALGNAMGGENVDPERSLAIINQLKVRAENDPEFFNKANEFIEERPGMVQIFAETFANDPDKAFAQLDQALALDNAMGGMEKLLSRFLGPELSGQIMGLMDNLMEMFMPIMNTMNDFKAAFSGEANDMVGQSNNGGELSRDAAAMTGNDAANMTMHDENGRPEQAADGQTLDERDPAQRATANVPTAG